MIYPEDFINRIICGDCLEVMKDIPDNSIDLVVTSPPYWKIKDYGSNEQIGYYDTYDDYQKKLMDVWKESKRALRKGGRLCINIGDQYIGKQSGFNYQIIPISSDIVVNCRKIGFMYMGDILWNKISNCNPSGGCALMGSYPYPNQGAVSFNYEHVLLFKNDMPEKRKINDDVKEQSIITKNDWKKYFSGIWKIGSVKQKDHPAMFPLELPFRLIKMFSFVNNIVIDPFIGSGTTAVACKRLNRHFIGIEISPEYCNIANERIRNVPERLERFGGIK